MPQCVQQQTSRENRGWIFRLRPLVLSSARAAGQIKNFADVRPVIRAGGSPSLWRRWRSRTARQAKNQVIKMPARSAGRATKGQLGLNHEETRRESKPGIPLCLHRVSAVFGPPGEFTRLAAIWPDTDRLEICAAKSLQAAVPAQSLRLRRVVSSAPACRGGPSGFLQLHPCLENVRKLRKDSA